MPERDPEHYLTDKTRLAAPIASWFQVAIVIGTMVACYIALRADVIAATKENARNTASIEAIERSLMDLKMDLAVFHRKYEDDMDRYIREHPEKHR